MIANFPYRIIRYLLGLVLMMLMLLIGINCTGPSVLLTGPVTVSSGIRFQLFYSEAKTISLAGTFNNWDPETHFLSENQPGHWSIVLPLPEGRYQYLFVIDQKTWITDPGSEMTIEDGFGQKNSLLVVEK